MIDQRLLDAYTWDAAPGIEHYYATVSIKATGQIIANCEHQHRTRETAERCAAKIARLLADPTLTAPTPTWTA